MRENEKKGLGQVQMIGMLVAAFVIGYLTSNRINFSDSLECILNGGTLIVVSMMFLITRVKETKKLWICCVLWALFFEIGGTVIRNIGLYLELGESFDYIIYAITGMIFTLAIFFVAGIVGSSYHKADIARKTITSLSIGYCAFALASYYAAGSYELFIGLVNALALAAIFFMTEKEDNKYKIISMVVGILLGIIM